MRNRLLLGMSLIAVTLTLCSGSAAAIECGWSAATNISNHASVFSLRPNMVTDSNGKVHLVYDEFWFDNTGGLYYTNNVNGYWATPTKIMNYSGKGNPGRIVITPDNEMHVFGGWGDLYWTHKPVSGGSWSTPTKFAYDWNSKAGGHIGNAVVDEDGTIHFHWVKLFDGDGVGRSALWYCKKPLNQSWSSGEWIWGTGDENKWPQGSRIYVDGTDDETIWCCYTYDKRWYYKKLSSGGSWGTGMGTQMPAGYRLEDIAWSPDGTELASVFILDVDGDADKYWLEVFISFSSDNGVSWSTPFNLSNAKALDRSPCVEYDTDGNLHVAWEGFGCDGCTGKVRWRTRIAGAWFENIKISDTGAPEKEGLVQAGDYMYLAWAGSVDNGEYECFLKTYDLNCVPGGIATVTGVVRDQNSQAVPSATVTLEGGGTTVTNASGQFSLGVPVATGGTQYVSMTASKEFYAGQTISNILVSDGQTTTQDFSITALPPDPVSGFTVGGADTINRLLWRNSYSGNNYATVIRYRTDTYPTGPTDGTLLVEWVGDGGNEVSYDHTGLTNSTTYYYAAFSRDNASPVHYSAAVTASGTPTAPTKANLLTNGLIGSSFTNGVANGWNGYVVNDPNTDLELRSSFTYYESQPAQRVSNVSYITATGLSAVGINQQVTGVTSGKVYMFVGYQDIFNDDYEADGQSILLNFGINPTGGTTPGTPTTDGTIGGCVWMGDEHLIWNDDGGSPVFYSGFHRSWSAVEAQSSTISVWSGVTIDNSGTKDNEHTKFFSDTHFLFEFDFSANASLQNGNFEGSTIDLLDFRPGGWGGDVMPAGWVPCGGATGEWANINVEATGGYSGAGVVVGNRRGVVNGGLMQKVSTTSGQYLEFSAYTRCSNNQSTRAMIGLDPTGGSDVNSTNIVWADNWSDTWTQLTVSAIAAGSEATVFIRSFNQDRWGTSGYHWSGFDNCTFGATAPPDPGTIAGYVKDECGNGINGATVTATRTGFSDLQTTTNASGYYQLSNAAVGDWHVTASASGYDDQTQWFKEVQSNQTTTVNFDLVHSAVGILSGTVTDDCDAGIANVTVATTTGCYSDTTDSNGNYFIANVPAGTYSLTATVTGYDQGSASSKSVSDGATTTVDFELTPAALGTISGTVTDQCGSALAGATVETTTGCYSTTTDANGDYTLSNVKGGTYEVVAVKTGYAPETETGVVVTDGGNNDTDFDLTEEILHEYAVNGNFEGNLVGFWGGSIAEAWGAAYRGDFEDADWELYYYDATRGKVMRMNDVAFGFEAGIRQQVTGMTSGRTYRVTADAYQAGTGTTAWIGIDDGSVQDLPAQSSSTMFPNVASQWQTVTITGTIPASGAIRVNLWAYHESGSATDVFFNNVKIEEVELLPGLATISGTVTESGTSDPIANAVVVTDTGGYSATTDGNGDYTINDVVPGTYDITASKAGYNVATLSDQSIAACSTADKDITMSTLSGTDVVSNGDFSSGFFSFWGGSIGNNWGAAYNSGYSDNDEWQSYNAGGAYGNCQRIRNLASGEKVGIRQEYSSLTAGAPWTLVAEAYQAGSGTTAWAAVTTETGTYLPSTGTQFSTSTGTWVPIQINGTVDSGGYLRLDLWAYRSGTASDVFFDNIQLIIGSPSDGTVTGYVYDGDGVALSGATVSTDHGGFSTTSGQDGSYSMDVTPDTYDISASLSGYVTDSIEDVSVAAGQTVSGQNLTLEEITGSEEQTNGDFASGYFSFWGGDIANDWGAAWRGTFASATWDDENVGGDYGNVMEMKNLASGFEAGIRQVVSGLTPGATYVFSAEAYQVGSGTVAKIGADSSTAADLPNPGTQFPATTGSWVSQSVSGTVDENGTVRIHLWAHRTGTASAVYFDNAVLLVTSMDPGSITGRVTSGSSGLSGATVSTDTGSYSTTTDANGYYTISSVDPGTYAMTASKDGYISQSITGVVVYEDSETTQNFDLDQVSGTEQLSNGDFSSGYFSFWGGDIGNSWGAAWTGTYDNSTDWDDENVGGDYGNVMEMKNLSSGFKAGIRQQITGLTAGNAYYLSAEAYQLGTGTTAWMGVDDGTGGSDLPTNGSRFPNQSGTWNSLVISGTVPANGTVRVNLWAYREGTGSAVYFDNISLLVETAPPGEITGTVLDDSSNPVEGATVSTDTGSYSTTTAADGSYTLSSVAAGTYAVTASKTGYNSSTTSGVVVTANNTTTVNLTIEEITGTDVLVNGDFEGGFYGFWSGHDMANSWGATWRGSYDSASWQDQLLSGDHSYVQRVYSIASGFEAGIVQEITGLTSGDTYTFSAEAYRTGSGTTAWLGVGGSSTSGLPSIGTQFDVGASTWAGASVTGTVPSDGVLRVYLWGYNQSGSSDVYFDNAELLIDSN